MMRHFSKSHGKHCYLRSFPTKCPTCNADVLYWECTHGSKLFFEYPPYGKLVRHYCRRYLSSKSVKTKYKVIVKKPQGLLIQNTFDCPICGKSFKSDGALKDHFKQLRKHDKSHQEFYEDKLYFKRDLIPGKGSESKLRDYPKFGRINIKKKHED